MADNFNINTTQAQSYEAGGIDPNNFGGTLEDALLKNQMSHQEQAELVQQAIERSKQAKIQTGEMQEDETSGARQASKGLISKEQAITTLKTGLANSSVSDEEKAQVLQDAEDTWPDVVSADGVHRMITALHEGRITKLGEGNPFQATGTETDADGTPFTKGTYIQSVMDTDGEEHFIHSNKPASVQNHKEGTGVDQKRRTDLVKLIAQQLRASRGNWLSQSLYRCSTELQRLDTTPNLTKQDLKQIAIGSAAIFTGGVPSEDEILKTEYGTRLGDLLGTITSWTGVVLGLPLKDIRQKMRDVLDQLYQELVHRFTSYMDFVAQGYLDVTEADPQWWADTREKALHAAEHGDSPTLAISGNLSPISSKVVSTGPASTGTAGQSTGNPQAKVPQYTVEE